MKFGTFVPYMCRILAMVTPLTIISKLELKLGKKYTLRFFLPLSIYSKIPILRPPLRLSKSGLKDHFWTVPKVVSNQRYTGCRK